MDTNLLLGIAQDILDKMPSISRKIFDINSIHKQCTMPFSHLQVLFYLNKYNSSSISDIATSLDISRPNMTPIIDNLISEGLVVRNTDSNDRRKLLISLTKKANQYIDTIDKKRIDYFTSKLCKLTDEDLISFHDSLLNIYNISKKL